MKILNLLFVITLCLLSIVFAVANRQWVALSMDPFSQANPALAIELPLFLIILGAVFLGMLIGATVTWFGQGRVRRSLRETKKQEKELRKQVEQAPAVKPKSGLPAVPTQAIPLPEPKPLPEK